MVSTAMGLSVQAILADPDWSVSDDEHMGLINRAALLPKPHLASMLNCYAEMNRPYFPRHLKSLKLRSFRRCYEQAATLHGRIQTGRRQASD
jgi:hypothetical protein